jgi:choline dehydrogenase-like flavoprotein
MADAQVERVDAVVVGSGFGGSVVACRLAEAGRPVCVLERGKRYPPGSFPRRPREMARNSWDPGAGLQWHAIRSTSREAVFELFNVSRQELQPVPAAQITEDRLLSAVALPM